ncbi:dihydrodipicolinate synthase family protein [Azospirillum brasilense]|uniref:dihydrodipicolinate synthase family protein n=1 Tax=Azospirillum brasilense TaxID=192 RepID=UPI000E67E215|nr:dihydrodipicolinate synthase family protein [Azospirillum brasilense]NUB23599.1 dihydrodipicolinate synthase family protein [Azospirillum brasilense]NUB30754.1 dihydrodipicolinate synthase family protein [Azospirillum brasilense]RIW05196.1 dihydrodipicolinate synthase family protein [Azospirillum brasilense]
MSARTYSGLFPVAPTPFHEDGTLDLEGQRRVLDCMIDQKVDGICILANYSEQFLVSDDERRQLTELCLEQVAGRVPVMVTCSHFSTRVAADRARHAAEHGAQLIMVMPPYHGASSVVTKIDETAIYEHIARVAEAAGIPVMIQDAPISGVTLSIEFLARLARTLPLVRYFKIEVPGTASKLRKLIEAGGDTIEGPFDGEEAITMMADLDAGATGVMSSALLPDLLRPVYDRHRQGNRQGAMDAYEKVLPLVNYENRQCGLRAAKTVMKEGGVIASDAVRHPLAQIEPQTKAGLLELARAANPLAIRWGK